MQPISDAVKVPTGDHGSQIEFITKLLNPESTLGQIVVICLDDTTVWEVTESMIIERVSACVLTERMAGVLGFAEEAMKDMRNGMAQVAVVNLAVFPESGLPEVPHYVLFKNTMPGEVVTSIMQVIDKQRRQTQCSPSLETMEQSPSQVTSQVSDRAASPVANTSAEHHENLDVRMMQRMWEQLRLNPVYDLCGASPMEPQVHLNESARHVEPSRSVHSWKTDDMEQAIWITCSMEQAEKIKRLQEEAQSSGLHWVVGSSEEFRNVQFSIGSTSGEEHKLQEVPYFLRLDHIFSSNAPSAPPVKTRAPPQKADASPMTTSADIKNTEGAMHDTSGSAQFATNLDQPNNTTDSTAVRIMINEEDAKKLARAGSSPLRTSAAPIEAEASPITADTAQVGADDLPVGAEAERLQEARLDGATRHIIDGSHKFQNVHWTIGAPKESPDAPPMNGEAPSMRADTRPSEPLASLSLNRTTDSTAVWITLNEEEARRIQLQEKEARRRETVHYISLTSEAPQNVEWTVAAGDIQNLMRAGTGPSKPIGSINLNRTTDSTAVWMTLNEKDARKLARAGSSSLRTSAAPKSPSSSENEWEVIDEEAGN